MSRQKKFYRHSTNSLLRFKNLIPTDYYIAMNQSATDRTIAVLSQEIGDEQGFYRIQVGHRVHHLTIYADTYDEDTMCRPYLLIPELPEFPDTDWTTMAITRDADGRLTSTISYDPLPAIQIAWHPDRYDILSLKRVKRYKENVHEVLFNGRPAIAKIARWAWEIPRIENETRAYSIITQHQCDPPIAPVFLGHLTENGRVMGLLLEKLDGSFASVTDLPRCEEVARKLHGMGLIHGDVNRYNFLVGPSTDNVRMVDFEHVEDFDEETIYEELKALPLELGESSGRGGPAMEF